MAKQVKQLQPPQGCSRVFFRTPIWFYRLGLGGVLGKRFLLLNHTGRKSGLPRQAVLEVVQHEPESNAYVVAVGFGPKSQWYQNILANPEVTVQVGWKKWTARATQLSPEEGGEVFVDFTKRYPGEAKFAPLLGFDVDGSEEDYRQMGEMMIFVRLEPIG
jgi:deazaflavin-dependent oxidoreductase (nitroreductase family)